VLKLSAETLDLLLVLEPRQETKETETTSILKPEIEDVLHTIVTFSNAESMVDQTTTTRVLKLMLDVQESHGLQAMLRLDLSTELPEKVGLKFTTVVSGDQSPPTTSGITTTALKLFVNISDMVKV
jgi:predicted methyltransferase